MRLAVVASALIFVAASDWNGALAQSSGPEAPVGLGQPTASSISQGENERREGELREAEKREKELDGVLDKKINSICRGC